MRKTKKMLEEEIKKLESRIAELEEENSSLKSKLEKLGHGKIISIDIMTEPMCIVGLGTVEIDDNWLIRTRVSLSFLKSVVKILSNFNEIVISKETSGTDFIDIAITEDYPLMLGKYDKDKKKFIGIIIAPKIDD